MLLTSSLSGIVTSSPATIAYQHHTTSFLSLTIQSFTINNCPNTFLSIASSEPLLTSVVSLSVLPDGGEATGYSEDAFLE